MSLDDDHGRPDDGGYGGSGHTRTRLPDGDGGYGPARRVPRSPRSLVTVVSVVVLLVAAIAFANRGGGEGSSDSASSEGGGPAAAPTAPSGQKPVSSGFGRDREGVQSAAANYAVALGSDGMYDSARRQEIMKAVYSPSVVAQRQRDVDKVYSDPKFLARIGLDKDGTAPDGQTFVTRFNPVGTKVEKYTNDAASVSVWYSALFGLAGEGSKNPVSESWYTSTFELKWVGGDWKVTDFKQKEGPAPVGRDQTASTAEEMADAIKQFGGFTYAR
ncbi:hypothetical protein [Streptomyces luteolus]|uniref:DUF8175 domain-containing protein n=1 Tax=Streptomyces luteolus TaxID=3043615 RepID=A0ABT6T820_9ACTN|nr:hypothetical protein [Streptomyces sp. B-S-A12]MDI3423974.1 hypothetical protein [Streptomyces sp. B-S-A12]